MEEKNSGWGGKRSGAGRKSLGEMVTVGLSLEKEVKEKLFRMAKAEGVSASAYVNRLLRDL